MTTRIHIPRTFPRPYPAVKVARNDAVVGAATAARIVTTANMIAGRRLKQLWAKTIQNYTNPRGYVGRARVRTSPYLAGTELHAQVAVYRPPTAPATAPWFRFYVDGVAQPKRYVTYQNAGTGTGLADHVWVPVKITGVAADTAYALELEVDSPCRPYAVSAYEPQATFGGSFPRVPQVNHPVLASDWLDVATRTTAMWKRQGTPYITWSIDNNAAVTSTTTGYNILDGSTAGYSSTAAGWYVWLNGRGRVSSETTPVECWVYASASSGTDTAVFYSSAGAIATVNITGAAGWYTATGSIPTNGTDPMLVTCELNNGGTGTASIYAAGMMDYQA